MFYTILAAILVVIGVIGVIVPILPGIPVIYLGLLIQAISHPHTLSPTSLIVFGILTIFSLLADWVGRVLGAKYGRISKAGTYGGIIGFIIGLIFTPFGGFSLLLAPPIGVIIGELIDRKHYTKAIQAGWWVFVGTALSFLVNIIIAAVMLLWFIRSLL